MALNIAEYLSTVQNLYASGQTTEHSFRPALAKLFDSIAADVNVVNEPKASVNVGRPDFVFIRGQITVGHCEAKDIGLDINPKGMKDFNKAQYERYVKALPNLIYTNGLDFRFYKNGELAREISIADYLMGIQPKPDQFDVLANQLKDFAAEKLQTITSAEKLAEMMAGKAVLIKDILFNTLKEDADLQTELASQFKAFKDQLIHDLGVEEFSDIYAETVAYGMFAARLHDETMHDFSREEALQLLPKSNPFLRNLFSYVAGPNLDEGIRRTIDELAEIFQAADLPKLFADFGKFTQRNDPFIHFYETFLAQYNPAKRKARGVWYTPEPVVNFIVRAVDDVLKTEFGLADGLADTSKITVDWDTGFEKAGKPVIEKRELHRVQILDPAAGTGTFLAEVIKQIAPKVKDVAPGKWSTYVEKELIPRLHGFELLMASYAMCHMKLDMMLKDMNYKPTANPPRLNVYLTNSLEEGDSEPKDLFMAKWLSNEANLANDVKRKTPIMCVIGNPPYSGESANKDPWIMGLMEAYKKEPGGKQKLQERNPKWINDDYVKFIRFAEHMIAKNGEGVLGFITNHGYLDNPTFRGMRWHLLNTFDKIWVLDLHGNSNKREVSPDGSPDKNVFDILQGVSIIVASKVQANKGIQKASATVFHGELWGDRKSKYDTLWKETSVGSSNSLLTPSSPIFPFVVRNNVLQESYELGFSVSALMSINSVGIVTARDALTIDEDRQVLWARIEDFAVLDSETLRSKYSLGKDAQDWKVSDAKADVSRNYSRDNLKRITYRPLDNRWTYFTGTSRGFQCRPRQEVMRQMVAGKNFGLIVPAQTRDEVGGFVSNALAGHKTFGAYDINSLFPLYLYPSESDLDQTRRVNMDPKIRMAIENAAEDKAHGRPDEVAIFDYIYGVLHCPAYRETYREFLKIDFPRVPYPPSPELFWDVSAKGTQLRRLHLMEDAAIGAAPFKFDGEGDSIVGKVEFKPVGENGRVFINDTQYFDDVPQIAWNFHIGGYQPAQKWLKDRKGRELTFDDIRHYQKIIKILDETDRIMKTIEMPLG
jgi:predicted helicase/CRISPR/Cas system CMR-associated protein Cmr5 small subunit